MTGGTVAGGEGGVGGAGIFGLFIKHIVVYSSSSMLVNCLTFSITDC